MLRLYVITGQLEWLHGHFKLPMRMVIFYLTSNAGKFDVMLGHPL